MKANESINYSKRKTLENLGEGYKIQLISKIEVIGIKEGTFKKGDLITIKQITLKKDKPHDVYISIEREGKNNEQIKMSGGVFLKYFISQIDKKDIVEKKKVIEENKDKVEEILKN